MAAAPSYIILGSGVFGASTALHLIRAHPTVRIRLVDRDGYTAPTRVAASWDWNKVVRADYRDILYTRLALEARDLWKDDPLYRPFYHESGIFWISAAGFADQVAANFAQLGVDAELRAHSVEEARGLYGGIFDDADYEGAESVLVNKMSGWADAKDVLQRVIEEAVALGVEYVEAEVMALVFGEGESGACRGVVTAARETLTADRVVLCTGAYTAKLLVDSAPERTGLHAGERFIAAAASEAVAPLNEEQLQSLGHMPVAIQEAPHATWGLWGSYGCLPPTKENLLKVWGLHIFRNTVEHAATGEQISVPPSGADYDQWSLPKGIRDDVDSANNTFWGTKAKDLKLEKYRLCWEAVTPSGDFIISPHSACSNLYVATCGSFHGWKFLPVIGKYVVQMLDKELDPLLAEKWAWDRELPATDKHLMWPRIELRDA